MSLNLHPNLTQQLRTLHLPAFATQYDKLDPLRLYQELECKQEAFFARVVRKEPTCL